MYNSLVYLSKVVMEVASIEEVSRKEHSLVVNAKIKYGKYYSNAKELVEFSHDCIENEGIDIKAHVFLMFHSQMNQALYQALLSSTRRHDVQTGMMLRYALESVVLSCYALSNPEIGDFVYENEHGLAVERSGTAKKARNWLEANYKDYSDKIKFMKDNINKLMTHSNIIAAFNNFSMHNDGTIELSLFDIEKEWVIKHRLWWIGNITFGVLNLISQVARTYPLIQVVESFDEKLNNLGVENEMLQQDLKSE